jgi:hypothetical protein
MEVYMKQAAKVIIFAVLILAMAAASSEAASGLVAGKGLKFGMTISALNGAGAETGLTSQVGFCGGGFLILNLAGAFSVQPEVLFTQKGAEFDSGSNYYEYHYSYIEIPLLLKLTLAGKEAMFRPSIYAGPFVGFKTSAKLETYLDPDQEESKQESLPSIRSVDAGIVVGAGADLHLGPGNILLDLRYGLSLLSAVTTGPDVKHSVIYVFIGYSFN